MFTMSELASTEAYKRKAKESYQRESKLSSYNRARNYIAYFQQDRNNAADTAGTALTTGVAATGVGALFSLSIGQFYRNSAQRFINYRAMLQQNVVNEREENFKRFHIQENTNFSNFILDAAETQMPDQDRPIEELYAYKKELLNIPPAVRQYAGDRYNRITTEVDNRIHTKITHERDTVQKRQHEQTTTQLNEISQHNTQLMDIIQRTYSPQEIKPELFQPTEMTPIETAQRIAELDYLLPGLEQNSKEQMAQLSPEMFNKAVEDIAQIRGFLADNAQQAQQQAQEQARQARAAAEIQQKLAEYDGIGQACNFTSQLGQAIGSKSLVQAGVIGQSLMKICAAKTTLDTSAVAGFAMLGPIGIIGGSALAIFQAFGPEAPDANQIIIDMLGQIKQQIEDFRTEMHERFEETFQRFDELFRFCHNGFSHIIDRLNNNVVPRLVQLQNTLDTLAGYIEQAELDQRLGQVSQDVRLGGATQVLNTQQSVIYYEHLARLAHHASFTASENYCNAASRTMAQTDPHSLTLALRQLFQNSERFLMSSNIDFLKELAPINIDQASIPNPTIWTSVVSEYIALSNRHIHPINGPMFTRDHTTSYAEIDAISKVGNRYTSFIRALKDNIIDVFTFQFLAYHQALDNVHANIQAIENEFQQFLQINNPQLRDRKPIDGIALGTDVVQFAEDNFTGYQALSNSGYQFTQQPWKASGKLGARFDQASKPNPTQLLTAACNTNPSLSNPFLNLAAKMGLGHYHFTFYIDVTNGSEQRWSSKMGRNGEKNGLETIFKFNNGANYTLSKGSPHVIWWRSITDEHSNIPQKDTLYSRLIYSVTNQGDNITTCRGRHNWGGPQTHYTPLDETQTNQVITILDAELQQKRHEFKERVLDAIETDLFNQAEQHRSLLISLLKLIGFSEENVINRVQQQLQQLENLTTIFTSYNPSNRELLDYHTIFTGSADDLNIAQTIDAIDINDEQYTGDFIDLVRVLKTELAANNITHPEFDAIQEQLTQLSDLRQHVTEYCESDDESDHLAQADQSFTNKLIRRAQWRRLQANPGQEQLENIAMRLDDHIYRGMLRPAANQQAQQNPGNQAGQSEQAVILRSVPLGPERQIAIERNILNTATTWDRLGLLHGVTKHVNKLDNTRRNITLVTKNAELDLETYLLNLHQHDQHLSKPQKLLLVLYVALSLREAHIRGLVYGRLQPRNILLFNPSVNDGRDYYAARIADIELPDTELDQALYQAPEVAAGREVQAQSDMFSLGITIWRILHDGRPYDPTAAQPLDPGHFANTFGFLVEMMQQCTQQAPDSRPSTDQVIKAINDWKNYKIQNISEQCYPGFFAASIGNNPIQVQESACTIM